MKSEKLKIEGMSCNHCVMHVKKELSKLDINIKDVQIGSADVEYDENKVSRDDLVKAVDEAGYKVII
ncbi:MAG: heavy-metal-associated domain-containing protein [Ignavibacteria bacterium]|jgi:copper chaperone|nr:heavy-metal-associated domain-containing protein [Ignavibacteria bacterium]MCU7502330.1 heavy-metal-associated domain-containing protein [Ignavibacteria bacterium]MCU7515105.1 heavy-metal-associated domain-containing protein [Ignavibacteria bacterium]